MNLSPDWIDVFEEERWQAVHWSNTGDVGARDVVIMEWARTNSGRFIPAMMGGITNAIADHEKERAERGGSGTAWGPGAAPNGGAEPAD